MRSRLDPVELRLRNDTQIDPEEQPAVRLAPSRRGVARGCRPLRLGQARRKAGQRPRRAMAGRSRRRVRDPRRHTAERDGACAPGERRPADGRTGDDRHRYRHLHDPDADRRRDDGDAGRPCHRSSGRHPLSAHRRLRRLLRGGDVRRGGSCRLPETQGWPRLRDDGSRRVGYARRARPRLLRTPASARISPKSAWIGTRARCVFDACSACSRPAASSMRRRRARR